MGLFKFSITTSLLIIGTLFFGCKTKYSHQEMLFINAFHDRDTIIYVSSLNESERDTVYFCKVRYSKNWLPGFRDGMKYSDDISINYKINDTAKDAYEPGFILLARAGKNTFTEITFKSFFCRFDNGDYCCLQDTIFKIRNGDEIKPSIYKIHYKMGADTTVPNRNGWDEIKAIWLSETKGLISYEYSSGKIFTRIN
jgi:hypothetical protein